MSQAVNDLLWVVNCPSFVTGQNVAHMPPLAASDIDADELENFLDERSPVHRVGRYFEQLVHYWLTRVRRVELLGAGIQIRDGKRTIGELDFVYREQDGTVVHCEVSVKFFLHHPRQGTSHFPGPNASDNFELKTDKLFDRQLELSRLHYPSVQRRDAIVKGMTFYRGERPEQLPARMHPDHATGVWMRAADLAQLQPRHRTAVVVVPKPFWLSPQVGATLLSADEARTRLEYHFASRHAHPLMVSLRDPETRAETERMFVVSEAWPVTSPQA